jgi:hypothetical protein
MSRSEIAQLERELKMLNEPVEDDFDPNEEGEKTQAFRASPEFLEVVRQMKILQPIRMGLIKRYFDKFKMQKSKREEILAAAEESEGVVKDILGEEYKHFTELLPEIKEFLEEHAKKEAIKLDQ